MPIDATPRKRLRYALVGAGNIGQVAILPGLHQARDNSELVAIVSGDAEKRRVLAERNGIELTGSYDELEQVLDRGRVDAVYIATPNHLHREHTERAARAGVHVLCEKPMAPSVQDCEAMIAACQAAGVRLMIAYRLHFEEATLRAIELARSGQIGKPRLFTALLTQQVRPGDVRTTDDPGAGALFDLGVYAINAARHLFDAEPKRVFAQTTRGDQRFQGTDASTIATLIFPGERSAQFSVSLETASVSTYRLIGEQGDLIVDPGFGYGEELKHVLQIGEQRREQSYPAVDQFAGEIAAFSRAVLENGEIGPGGDEGLADVRIIQALLESAEQGRAIDLPAWRHPPSPRVAQALHIALGAKAEAFKAPAPTRG